MGATIYEFPRRAAPRWHVLHVITRLDLGGAQFATLTELTRTEFVTGERWLAYGPGGELDREVESIAGIVRVPLVELVRDVSPLNDARAVAALTRTIRSLQQQHPRDFVIVHTHSSKAGVLGRLAAFAAGADVIVHSIHGFGHPHHGTGLVRRATRAAERIASRLTDGFTTDSAANLEQGKREGLIRRQPAQVVHCGIDLEHWARPQVDRAQMRRALQVSPGDDVVINVSCLKPQKDPLLYVEVARKVLAHRPATTFLLVGDGELRRRVEQAALRYDLGSRFRLLGWRRDVRELLHASDLLVLTSRWEGLPQTLAQAMVAGLATVATEVDGTPEAVADGINGLLYEPGDADGMAEAVTALLADPARRARMGRAARRAAVKFADTKMLEDVDALYDRLAGAAFRNPLRQLGRPASAWLRRVLRGAT